MDTKNQPEFYFRFLPVLDGTVHLSAKNVTIQPKKVLIMEIDLICKKAVRATTPASWAEPCM
jgi:hypothetical protein